MWDAYNLRMKKSLIILCATAALCACGTQQGNESVATDRPLPVITDSTGQGETWIYNEAISDEFEAQFDTTKWYNYNPNWLGRHPSLFCASNVRTEGGELILTGKREEVAGAPAGYHTFSEND